MHNEAQYIQLEWTIKNDVNRLEFGKRKIFSTGNIFWAH